MKTSKLPPAVRSLVERAERNGACVYVSTKRTPGRVPVLMFSINGFPRKPLGDVIDQLERTGART